MPETLLFTVSNDIEYKENNEPKTRPSRDAGKTFSVELMSAWDCEKWATEAVFALTNAKGSVEVLLQYGIYGLMQLPFDKYESLMARLMKRVKYVLDPMKPNAGIDILPGHFEEVNTLFQLKKFVLESHINFYTSGIPQI